MRPAVTGPSRYRIVFDVSSLARWLGPAVGIARVDHQLAAYARAQRPDIVLAVYDPLRACFREVLPRWSERVLGWDGAIDTLTFNHRRHWSRWRQWRSPRYPLMMAMERWRLSSRSPHIREVVGAMQRSLWPSGRLPMPFADGWGRRFEIVSAELALGESLRLGSQDIVATAGYDWANQSPGELEKQKRRSGFRYVATCYDLIPLKFSQFFVDADARVFRYHWQARLSFADGILVHSKRVRSDIRDYCVIAGIQAPPIRLTRLGADPPSQRPDVPLPKGLEPSRFILFVSTIEPRKGHAMLIEVWRRLMAAGVPQRHRFKLVFVGRRGWLVDQLMRQIDELAVEGSLFHFESVDDRELAAIYDGAAFCVYPSLYEGFGLPIVEGFSHAKAVIASTGGALPETVGELSPCLDPNDEEAWFVEVRRWIEDPAARAPYERKIRECKSRLNWEQAAAQFFEAVGDLGASRAPASIP
jgi:glycosyltransferase involved in cell wall biosynthesis